MPQPLTPPTPSRPVPPPPKALHDIMWVTAEVFPFSSTGGLGFVSGALPATLAARGHRVVVVAPMYGDYSDAGVEYTGVTAEVLGQTVGFHRLVKDGVDYIFVAHPSLPRPGGFYADDAGAYGDNHFRFALLALAALEAPLVVDFSPARAPSRDDPIFIANDWHAALVPVYLASKFRPNGVYAGARSVVAIHNARHQGVFSPRVFPDLGIAGDWYGALEWQYPPHKRAGAYEEEGRAINFLKGGVATADRLVTVSPRHAWEIQTPEGGWDLDGLLSSRAYVLSGVMNGIGGDWEPATDPHLESGGAAGYRTFDATTVATGKAACKAALQAEVGLPVDPTKPVVAFIGRLDYQKSADMVLAAAGALAARGAQLVCLGSGDAGLSMGLRSLEGLFPDAARGVVGFDVPFSHRLNAGADILVMPSRFEPCGLNQLYAMAAGTVPVVHATGGLADSVATVDAAAGTGTGWAFSPCDQPSFEGALNAALDTYYTDKGAWAGIVARCMDRDSSWGAAAVEWEAVLDWAKTDPPYAR